MSERIIVERQQTTKDTITHVWSDGLTTQYRNKTNLYLFSTLLLDWGFKVGTWILHKAGDGYEQQTVLVTC